MITPEKPELAKILDVKEETQDTKTFTVSFADKKRQEKFFFVPGKFMMVSAFGHGEIPISISSSPYETQSIKLTIVDVGTVTHAIHGLKKGEFLGLRGPFGNGFPLAKFRKKNLLFVSGGCGIAPLRSLIYAAQAKKREFGKIQVLSGCKTPESLLFQEEIKEWEKTGTKAATTVDKPSPNWKGNVGLVTSLFKHIELPPEKTVVAICGPPIMIHFSIIELEKKGFTKKDMYASTERMMQCGVGYCSHCNIGNKYTCIDGPVFTAEQLEHMPTKED